MTSRTKGSASNCSSVSPGGSAAISLPYCDCELFAYCGAAIKEIPMDRDRQSLPRVYELSRPEHMLVWALRAICLGHEDCPMLAQTFSRLCGDFGPQALAAYHAVVMTIG